MTRFTVTPGGEVNAEPEPTPDADDRRRAALLAEGGKFDKDAEDLFARGIAVARSGGDVRAFLDEEIKKRKSTRLN